MKKEHDLKHRNTSILIPIDIDITRDFCCVEQVSNPKLAFQGRKSGKLLNHSRYMHAMQNLNIYWYIYLSNYYIIINKTSGSDKIDNIQHKKLFVLFKNFSHQ